MSPELRLIRRAADGDDRAYETWLSDIRPALLRYAADRLGGDHAEAEDVVQDAAVRALLALRDGRVPENPRAWMYVIVRNRCHDVRAARRPSDPLDERAELLADGRPSPDDVLAGRRRLAAVVDAIGELREAQRRAVVGASFEGRPYEELAAREAMSVQAVKSLVHRARRGLAASGARAAACSPALVLLRLRALLAGGGDGARANLAQLVSDHTAAVAGVAAVAVAVPAVTVGPELRAPIAKVAHAAVAPDRGVRTVAEVPAAAPDPQRLAAAAARASADDARPAAAPGATVLQACRSGSRLDAFTITELSRARQALPATDREYGGGCAPAIDRALIRATR